MDFLIAEMRKLRRESTELRRGQNELFRVSRRQSCRVDQVVIRMDAFLDYSTNFNSTLSHMFNTSRFNTGMSPLHFPAPPIFPDYTLDTKDEDEDDDA